MTNNPQTPDLTITPQVFAFYTEKKTLHLEPDNKPKFEFRVR